MSRLQSLLSMCYKTRRQAEAVSSDRASSEQGGDENAVSTLSIDACMTSTLAMVACQPQSMHMGLSCCPCIVCRKQQAASRSLLCGLSLVLYLASNLIRAHPALYLI